MHYGLLSQSTLEIKEAVHYETMELVEDWQRDFFYYPFALVEVVSIS